MNAKQPTGGEPFDSLMRKLAQVGKADAEKQDRAWRKARKQKRKRKGQRKQPRW